MRLSSPVSAQRPARAHALAAAAAALAVPQLAAAQHADIGARVESGRIVTGAHSHGGAEAPNQRVYGYDFQEDPVDPYFAGDPGFNADPGDLPAGSDLRFNLLSGLSYWGGTGPVAFTAAPSGETLRMTLGSGTVMLTSPGGPQPGFRIGGVAADGTVHSHLNTFLNGSDGNNDPSDGNPPADGVYLFSLELTSTAPDVAPSEPLFVVFNNGLLEDQHDAAIDYVETNLVPEPGGALTAATLGLSAALLRRSRPTWRH